MNETIKWLYNSDAPVLNCIQPKFGPVSTSSMKVKAGLKQGRDTFAYDTTVSSGESCVLAYGHDGGSRLITAWIYTSADGVIYTRGGHQSNWPLADYRQATWYGNTQDVGFACAERLLKEDLSDFNKPKAIADVKTEVIPFPDQKGRDVISVPNVVGTSALAPDIWVGDEQDTTSEPIFFLPYNSNWNPQTGTQQEAQKAIQIENPFNSGGSDNANSYTPLYPTLTKGQVIGWDAGEIVGPYTLEVKATDWVRNTQTLDLNGVSAEDIVRCVKVLEGTEEQMLAQNEAYQKLNLQKGIQSLNNQVMFTCDEVPNANFKVKVWWTK